MKRKTILRRLLSNIPYKLFALVVACIVWYIVQGEEILEINRKLEVMFEVPPGFAIREGQNVVRDVTLRGPRVALSDFSDRAIRAVIRVPSGKRGSLRYRLDKEFIPHWDNRIRITVHDPYVTIFVDERASRSIPVRVAILGSPKAGVSIRDVKSEPSEVTITGLKSDIQKQGELSTEIVDVNGISEGKSFPVPISTNGLPDFVLSSPQVVVHVSVEEEKSLKTFDDVSIEVLGSEKLSHVRPQTLSVTVQGTPQVLANITVADIQATLHVHGLAPGRYEKEVVIKAPSETVLVSSKPKQVIVEIYNQKKLK